MSLQVEDFDRFFFDVHGVEPFPWQRDLLRTVAESGQWPRTLDLPTGSGKTSAIDIAVFHLALEAQNQHKRGAAVRIAFVVDRRLVVDDAYARAQRIEQLLKNPKTEVINRVADQLKVLAGDGPPLVARRLRGGAPREDDWARTPVQPTVLCSTVDQVGSRLLFRGYGISESMRPVHAGLLGSDCLVLLDEAHLAEPFQQTLDWVQRYHDTQWREQEPTAPWNVALLTATPGQRSAEFSLTEEDRSHPVLTARLQASKPALLVERSSGRDSEEPEDGGAGVPARVQALVDHARAAIRHCRAAEQAEMTPAIGIIVNRVRRARQVFSLLKRELAAEIERGELDEPLLLIGPVRPADRRDQVTRLDAIERGLIIVATQCLEAGVDIDLDALITEAAPLDALRQRFGRLNRGGRPIRPYAAILAEAGELSTKYVDPVYETAIRHAWNYLVEGARLEGEEGVIDFGSDAFASLTEMNPIPSDALAPKPDAPVLLPAHVDLFSQTSPAPANDPDVALFLHGPDRQPDAVRVVWRADIEEAAPGYDPGTTLLLTHVPPRPDEAIELPVWEVQRWLRGDRSNRNVLADVPVATPDVDETPRESGKTAFRWRGPDNAGSSWVSAGDLRPGDLIIVPCTHGGADGYGWDPAVSGVVRDVADEAAQAYDGRRFAVRVTAGLIAQAAQEEGEADGEAVARVVERVAAALAEAASSHTRGLVERLEGMALPALIHDRLARLKDAREGRVELYTVNRRAGAASQGIVIVAALGLKQETDAGSGANVTEDDLSGSLAGYALPLSRHESEVEHLAATYAQSSGMSANLQADIALAARLHDRGKADQRFQAWLWHGDVIGPDPDSPDDILAKSFRPLPANAREASGLPGRWRHEAASVRCAVLEGSLDGASDPDLVLWLIGTHHGHGRPLYPHSDPTEHGVVGPQSLAFDWRGLDWATLFEQLKARYGTWELARMECLVRLADHRASELAGLEEA
jgi:CRISPR-associated endonuclease/helicase Cas3